MTQAAKLRNTGVFPVAPTVFDENGELDLEGRKRCTDLVIDAGSTGAASSPIGQQFVLTDAERERVMHAEPCCMDRW